MIRSFPERRGRGGDGIAQFSYSRNEKSAWIDPGRSQNAGSRIPDRSQRMTAFWEFANSSNATDLVLDFVRHRYILSVGSEERYLISSRFLLFLVS